MAIYIDTVKMFFLLLKTMIYKFLEEKLGKATAGVLLQWHLFQWVKRIKNKLKTRSTHMVNHRCSGATLGDVKEYVKSLKKRRKNLYILLVRTNGLWVDIDTKYMGKNTTIISEELHFRWNYPFISEVCQRDDDWSKGHM